MIALYIILSVAALFVFLAAIAPKSYNINRNISINKSVSEIFPYLKHIKNQEDWSPWKTKDPDMQQSYVGIDGDVGFIARWEGNKKVGSGEQELTKIVENERIESKLRFFKPWKSQSNSYITVDPIELEKTAVTWGFSGVSMVPANIFFSSLKSIKQLVKILKKA